MASSFETRSHIKNHFRTLSDWGPSPGGTVNTHGREHAHYGWSCPPERIKTLSGDPGFVNVSKMTEPKGGG